MLASGRRAVGPAPRRRAWTDQFKDRPEWPSVKFRVTRPDDGDGYIIYVNFFDTANVYSYGTSEEITGSVLRELANRDELFSRPR